MIIRNPFKRYRIGYLFFGSFAGFIILVLLVVTWVSYHFSVQEMINNTTYYQLSILKELNKQLENQLRLIEQVSLAISRDNNLQDYLTGQGDSYTRFRNATDMTISFSNITYSIPIIHSVHLYMDNPPPYDVQGPVQYFPLNKMKAETWFTVVKNSDSAWIGQHSIKTNNGDLSVISFARKIYTTSGDFKALLLLNIKSDDIQNLMQGQNKGSNRLLLDSGGRPITFTGDSVIQNKIHDHLDIMKDQEGYSVVDGDKSGFLRNSTSLIVWAKSFNENWLLVEVTPLSQLAKGSLRLAIVLSSIGVLAIIVALFFTLFLSKQFTEPIQSLIKGMKNFPGKQKTEFLPNDYQNEFGLLFLGYHRLIHRIEKLYSSLKEQYRRQREAEIKALQAMINPHFLYNTLDQLNWMAIEAGQERISHVLELMGKMFRIGLSNGESLILIGDELIHIECYLQIQQIRGKGLTFRIEVADEFKKLYIPKLTLQPFVENAVIHGFHGRNTGCIEIKAKEENDDLIFSISDDGVGIEAGWQMKQRKTGGYGIRNVRERLKAYFGPSYGISIINNDGRGTVVYIRIPKIKDKRILGGFKNVENRDY
jgi:two-component system sensor histidine kinase YesM